jgi:hypothetical protein
VADFGMNDANEHFLILRTFSEELKNSISNSQNLTLNCPRNHFKTFDRKQSYYGKTVESETKRKSQHHVDQKSVCDHMYGVRWEVCGSITPVAKAIFNFPTSALIISRSLSLSPPRDHSCD